jgi:hypothetical protein
LVPEEGGEGSIRNEIVDAGPALSGWKDAFHKQLACGATVVIRTSPDVANSILERGVTQVNVGRGEIDKPLLHLRACADRVDLK